MKGLSKMELNSKDDNTKDEKPTDETKEVEAVDEIEKLLNS